MLCIFFSSSIKITPFHVHFFSLFVIFSFQTQNCIVLPLPSTDICSIIVDKCCKEKKTISHFVLKNFPVLLTAYWKIITALKICYNLNLNFMTRIRAESEIVLLYLTNSQ